MILVEFYFWNLQFLRKTLLFDNRFLYTDIHKQIKVWVKLMERFLVAYASLNFLQ